MAFVYERMDETARQEIKRTLKPYQTVLSVSSRVIDHEINVIFYNLGGQGHQPENRGEPPTYYAMNWQGEWIVFEGRDTFKGVNDIEWHNYYVFSRLRIPLALKEQVPQVQETIQSAMDIFSNANKSKVSERKTFVHIQFPEAKFY